MQLTKQNPTVHAGSIKSNISKPKLVSVPLATGLAWGSGSSSGYLYQEKSDGVHEFAYIAGAVVNAERMRDGWLIVNDIVSIDGHDMSGESTATRWLELVRWSQYFASHTRLCRVGNGGDFLGQLLASGGEGIVAKPLESPFAVGWLKCKRCQVFRCIVTSIDYAHGTVGICDAVVGGDLGKLAIRDKVELVRIGSVLKVEAFGRTAKGLLREARLDKDTPQSWLIPDNLHRPA